MKKSLMALLLTPIFVLAYPIYDEEVPPVQTQTEFSSEGQIAEDFTEEDSIHREEEAYHGIRKQVGKKGYTHQDQSTAHTPTRPAPSVEERQSSITKRDPIKRNSALQNPVPKAKPRDARKNPNRPRVTHRAGQKPSQNLPKIEADADEREESLSAYENKAKQESNSSAKETESAEQRKKGLNDSKAKENNHSSSKDPETRRSLNLERGQKKRQGRYSGRRSIDNLKKYLMQKPRASLRQSLNQAEF